MANHACSRNRGHTGEWFVNPKRSSFVFFEITKPFKRTKRKGERKNLLEPFQMNELFHSIFVFHRLLQHQGFGGLKQTVTLEFFHCSAFKLSRLLAIPKYTGNLDPGMPKNNKADRINSETSINPSRSYESELLTKAQQARHILRSGLSWRFSLH